MRSLFIALTVLGVVAVALAGSAPAGADSHAVAPENRPTAIAGHENGRLPGGTLISVTADCRVARGAGPSLRLLLDLSESDGTPLGVRSCYRPIDDQVRVRRQWTDRGNSACAAAVRQDPTGRVIGTSMHGWGKAVDFSDAGRSMTFSAAGYRFLSEQAARVGWNQPGWARQGGGPCPEAWHWEWVGDGGVLGRSPVPADAVALIPRSGQAHSVVSGLGGVHHVGGAPDHGNVSSLPLAWVVVGGASSGSGSGGYYLVAGDGGVFAFGDAPFHGSTGHLRLNRPVVDMATSGSTTSNGYWLVAGDGGVFSFGAAGFHGSTASLRLNRSVVALAATPTGAGYWLVAGDGGVFSFGDARFSGSTGHLRLAEPVTSIAATATGGGYWMVAADGGVFAFGDAGFHGSAAGAGLTSPVVDITPTPTGGGYWLLAADGTVLPFGDAGLPG